MPKQGAISNRTRSKTKRTFANAELHGGPSFGTCAKEGKNWRTGHTNKKGTKVPSACVEKKKRAKRADAGMTRAQWRSIKAGHAKGITKTKELIY